MPCLNNLAQFCSHSLTQLNSSSRVRINALSSTEVETDVVGSNLEIVYCYIAIAGLSLVQVQQVPLNLSIFGKGTMEGEIAKRIIIESVNFQDMDTLEPVICRT